MTNATDFIVNSSVSIDELNYNMTMTVLPVTIFIGIETIVGLSGNILILLVYSKRYEKSNFRYFVLFMALIDLTSSMTTLPGEIFSQMNWYTYHYDWICKVKSFFNVFTAWASASILLLLGFDRYRKICRPLRWQIRPSVARRLCVVFVVLSSLVATPILLLWGRQTYVYEHRGSFLNVSICEKSEKFATGIYPLLYIGLVYVFPLGIMIIVVCSLNALTAKALFDRTHSFSRFQTIPQNSNSSSSVNTEVMSLNDIPQANAGNTISTPAIPSDQLILKPNVMDAPSTCISDNTRATTGDINKQSLLSLRTTSLGKTSISFITLKRVVSQNPSGCNIPNNDVTFRLDITECEANDPERIANNLQPSVNKPHETHKKVNGVNSTTSDDSTSKRKQDAAMRQKTIIMLVLTFMFVFTMTMYVVLTCLVAGTEGTLKNLNNPQKVVFFFFWRLYFINTNINPILYGLMDQRFRSGLLTLVKR